KRRARRSFNRAFRRACSEGGHVERRLKCSNSLSRVTFQKPFMKSIRGFSATIAVAYLCSTAAAAPLVTYQSPCECLENHGKQRWTEKNDPAQPPSDASTIQAVTPSNIFNWQGPAEYLVPSSARIWSEQKWYALTGRVVDLRAEEDGDLHIALQDVT